MIYVYKTTVDSNAKLELATQVLNELLPDVLWNFDLEDCDNILRIDSKREINQSILKNNIFDYVELE